MLTKTMKIALALLIIAAMHAATPPAGIAAPLWNRISLPGKLFAGYVPVISMSPNFPSDHTIFMADGLTFYESKDGGKSWIDPQRMIMFGGGNDPTKPTPFYGGYSTTKKPTAKIYISQNLSSSSLVVLSSIEYGDFIILSGKDKMFGSLGKGFMGKTVQSEENTTFGHLDIDFLQGFAFAPDGTMYAAGGTQLVYGTINWKEFDYFPATWNRLADIGDYTYGIKLPPDFTNDKTMLIQTGRGLLFSANGGKGFINTSLPVVDGYYDMEFSPNYAVDETIAVVVPGAGLFISTDTGASWNNVLPGASITAAAIGPSGAIYAGSDYTYGTQDGIYASFDKGQHWQNIGLKGSKISSLYAFRGTNGDQVYAATDSDLAWTTVPRSVSPTGSAPVRFVIGQNYYTLSGNTYQMDATPFIEKGRAYVPARCLADALGCEIDWDEANQAVTISDHEKVLKMVIGSNQLTVNGEKMFMDAVPILKDDRTYLPARFVATALNYKVVWDDRNQAVVISK